MTQYFVAINGEKVPKVQSTYSEKKLTKMSGNFTSKIIDRDNTIYDSTTSGDEFEIIQNNKQSTVEVQSNYATATAINWYKFNDNLDDSAGVTTPSILVRATGYYPFNGNANDESTSGNNGTVSGATLTTDRFGNADKAYDFTALTDYISLGTSSVFNVSTAQSVFAWVKTTDTNSNGRYIFVSRDASKGAFSILKLSSNKIQVVCGTTEQTLSDTTNINDGNWHHVGFVFDGTNVVTYLDGVAIKSGAYKGTAIDNTVDKRIGTRVGGNFSWIGSIDEVTILPVALTANEVSALYETTSRHDWNDVFVDGKFGKCADFGATNNYGPYVSLGSLAIDSQTAHSFSAWVYLNSTWEASGAIVGGRRGDTTSFAVTVNRTLECREDDYGINSVSTIPLETWTHVVYTYSGGTMGTVCTIKCYINGILDNSYSQIHTGDFWTSVTSWIGYESRFHYHFNGRIDDVRVFNSELTESDVKNIYNNFSENKVFGGLIENITRDEKRNYLLTISGGDYTTKLNQVTIDVQAYDDREYSVIVRDLMNTYLMKAKVIDDFEATTGWTAAGDFGSLSLQTGTEDGHKIARVGNGAIQVLANYSTGTGTLTRTFATSKDFLETDYITLYIYVDDITKLGINFRLNIGQDSSNYYTITKASSTLVNGWNYVEFDMATATQTGSPTLTDIDYYQFSFDVGATASNVTILFDDMRRTPHGALNYTLSNVDFTEYYTTILFKNVTIHEAIKKIANIRPTKYDFFVDINKVLDFSIMGTQSSGVTLQKGVNILSTNFCDDDTNLCNEITVYGGRQQFSYEETFNGDSSTLEFTVAYEPVDAYVTVGGTKKLGYQEGMASSDYDYKIDQKNRKIIFATGKAPTTGTNNVVIRYTYSVPIIVKNTNPTSIADYGLRSKKIENPQLLTKEDVQAVAVEYINKWSYPIINGKVVGKIEPNIDVGETIQYINDRNFSTPQTFVVAGIKQNFIGSRLNTEYTLTSYQNDLEQYLNDLFDRLNALEEKEKGQSEVVSQLTSFLDSLDVNDDPENNLAVKFKNIAGDTLIWGSTDFGIWGTFKWGSDANTSFILGLSKLGINGLGSVSSDWGANQITNPSD